MGIMLHGVSTLRLFTVLHGRRQGRKILLGRLTYREVKTRRDQSMSGKSG